MRRATVLFVALSGCAAPMPEPPDAAAPDPQREYRYEGCAPAAADACPNLSTYACALRTIRLKHAACTADEDCVVEPWDDCVDVFACSGAAVARESLDAFRAEADPQRAAYCDGAACRSGPSCGSISDVPACVQGRCEAVSRP